MYAIPMRVAGDLRATRLMQSDSGACRVFLPPVPSLCVSAYVCCTVCVCAAGSRERSYSVVCSVVQFRSDSCGLPAAFCIDGGREVRGKG
jgi:hypothetical protein